MFDSREIIERIVEGFTNGTGRPFMLELRPTNRCNLRCPSCVARGRPHPVPEEELSEEEYLRIIDEAAELGVRYVQISGGGEPFMRRDELLRIMSHIKSHEMVGWVITNGTLFDAAIIEEIVKMQWDTIFLSLDAPDPATNDFLRSKTGSFDALVLSVRQFNQVKMRYGHDLPRIHVGSVLSHYTCKMLKEMITLCAELDVQKVTFQPVHVGKGDKGNSFLLSEEDLETLSKDIPLACAIGQKLKVNNNLDCLKRELLEKSNDLRELICPGRSDQEDHPLLSLPCFSPWYYIGISTDGAVGPCSIFDSLTYRGDIRHSSLRAYWEGSHFKDIRDSLSRKRLPPMCRNCTGTQVMETEQMRERLKEFTAHHT